MSSHDEWKATWDWAEKVWAPEGEDDFTFNWFFGQVAQKVAEAEGWEELGSSDVWHATKWMVDDAKRAGVTTRVELMEKVIDVSGHFWGAQKAALILLYAGNSSEAAR